jgi:type IV pilus assembly protein PilW
MTMVELLLAMVIAGLIAAAALSLAFSSRDLYEGDRVRTDLNQNLRSGVDLLGMEIRQAGERLPLDFPAIEIVDGGGSNPDTMIVRRNLLDAVLPICAEIQAGTTVQSIRVASDATTPPPGCSPVEDANSDSYPDNVDEWRAYRDANGGTITVYLFNPVSGAGEYVLYDGDDATSHHLGVDSDAGWQQTYLVNEQCRVYVLEQHAYEVAGGVLRYVADGDTANPVNLVHDIVDFQVRAVLLDGTVLDSFSTSDDWSDLESIEITLTDRSDSGPRPLSRTVTTRFFPRNALSI